MGTLYGVVLGDFSRGYIDGSTYFFVIPLARWVFGECIGFSGWAKVRAVTSSGRHHRGAFLAAAIMLPGVGEKRLTLHLPRFLPPLEALIKAATGLGG